MARITGFALFRKMIGRRRASQPDTAISVDIYDGDTLLATIKGDAFRKDLIDRGNGG
jgi:hypothetical protein